MATTDLIGTPQRADHPTASLPPAAVQAMARIEYALAPVVAEQHRIERLVSGLRVGESTVINGTPVTAISAAVADLLARYQTAAAHYRVLAACGDYHGCLPVQDEMTLCRCQLAEAGQLHLIEMAS